MPLRHPRHTFLLVAATGEPVALLRGLPRPERMPRAADADTLVYDLGRLSGKEHGRLADALATFRDLPYLAAGAPTGLLVGGAPAMVIDVRGKPARGGLGGRFLDLLRNAQ
jgi:hypothetical protein